MLSSFRLPPLEDGFYIAPATLVVDHRLPERLLDPLLRIDPLRLLQFIGHDVTYDADVLLI